MTFPSHLSPSAGLNFADANGLAAISKVPAAGQGFEVAGRSKQDRIITYNRLNLVNMFVDAV